MPPDLATTENGEKGICLAHGTLYLLSAVAAATGTPLDMGSVDHKYIFILHKDTKIVL